MRRVCVVTGTRAEYGLLRHLMQLTAEASDLELQVVVAGMHLSPEFGLTVQEIERDGFRIAARVDMLFSSDHAAAMAKGVGVGIYGIAQALESMTPDVVVVLGDRVEAFAAAAAASLSNIIVAHLHGGDKSQGGLDESMRHAITKLAHLHFAATRESADRILKLGEEPNRIFVVGAPGLDEILHTDLMTAAELGQLFGFDFTKEVCAVVQHPVSTEPENAGAQMRETLEAVRSLGLPTVVVSPNSDAGSHSMLEVLDEYRGLRDLKIVKSLERRQYLSLLHWSRVLVGNSSSGIIEAPFLGTPVVNVGTRQCGREQAGVVIQTDYRREDISAAIEKALHDPSVREAVKHVSHAYGDGRASERIVDLLRTLPLQGLHQKTITF